MTRPRTILAKTTNDSGLQQIVVARAGIAPYHLRLRRPWVTAMGSLFTRSGWLVRLESTDGAAGFGDCAPLPQAGTESPRTAEAALRTCLAALCGRSLAEALAHLDTCALGPAVRCAAEGAILDLAARRAGLPLARYLRPRAHGVIAVNASLGAVDGATTARARQALRAGYRVLKIKLGSRPLDVELSWLQALVEQLPEGSRLRLDANGAWSEPTAAETIGRLRPFPIDALEEPLRNPDSQALARLQSLAPWPLALDESLTRWSLDRVLANPPVQRLVLKPMVVGGLMRSLDVGERARAIGLGVVITTTLDSAVGTGLAVHLAAALAANEAHGLATSEWLREDVGDAPAVLDGQMAVPAGAGLGMLPTESVRFETINGL